MKKGIRGHDVNACGIENISKRCLEKNIDYVQLVLEKSDGKFRFGEFSIDYAKEIKAKLGGLKIGILGSYINASECDGNLAEIEIRKFKGNL